MIWDDLKLYVWLREQERRAQADYEAQGDLGGSRERRRRLVTQPPTREELGVIPWAGEGPDPLLEEFS